MRYIIILSVFIQLFFSQCNSKSPDHLEINLNDSTLNEQIIKLSKQIQTEPNNHEYYYLRSNEWLKINNLDYALKDISVALDLSTENAVYNYKKAELLMERDSADAKTAQKLYEKAIKLEPNFEDALLKLGKLYLARQEYENALGVFDKLIAIDMNNARAYFYKGMAFKENNFKERAKEMFLKTVETDNSYYDGYMQLGELYADSDPKLANQFYDNALRIDPESDETLYAKGFLAQKESRFKDAYAYYEQALKFNNGHKFAAYNSAFIDIKFDNFEEAAKTLDGILLLDNEFAEAYTLRAFNHEKQKHFQEAIADYQKALTLNPQDSLAIKGLKAVGGN